MLKSPAMHQLNNNQFSSDGITCSSGFKISISGFEQDFLSDVQCPSGQICNSLRGTISVALLSASGSKMLVRLHRPSR